jgi:hypothetical protein
MPFTGFALAAVLVPLQSIPPKGAVDIAIREKLIGETFYGLYPSPMREVATSRLGMVVILQITAAEHRRRSEAFLKGAGNDRERAALLRLTTLLPAYAWANAEMRRQFPDAGTEVNIDMARLGEVASKIDATSAPRHRLFRDHWAAKAVGDLRALRMLDGYPDGRFRG